jgi:hypothetical protein
MLKNSARNSIFFDSVSAVSFTREKSKLEKAGVRKVFRPRFPGAVWTTVPLDSVTVGVPKYCDELASTEDEKKFGPPVLFERGFL